MATKVHMEALSPTMEEGQLVKWLKSEGDTIAEGDVLAEIETDKATMELVARGSGVLQSVTLKEGGTAPVGEVIAVIAGEGEAEGGDAPAPEARAPADSTGISASDSKKESDEAEPAGDEAPQEADSGAKRKEPAKAATQATDAEQPSGRAEPSTETKAAAPEERSPKAAAPEEPKAAASDESGNGREGRVKASPLARRLAEEAGVELSAVEGTGPGGRITKRDIEAAAEGGGRAKAGTASGAGAESAAGAPTDSDQAAVGGAAPTRDGADSEEVPVTQMRKAIAKRLAQSIGPIPTFYLTIECDMTRMADMRERTNVMLEKDGIKASINDFIIKAVAAALARHPEVNASWGDKVIVRHHRVHIGVAVAVEDGLITPIVRDADAKRVREIAVEVKELAGRAREKKLKPE